MVLTLVVSFDIWRTVYASLGEALQYGLFQVLDVNWLDLLARYVEDLQPDMGWLGQKKTNGRTRIKGIGEIGQKDKIPNCV